MPAKARLTVEELLSLYPDEISDLASQLRPIVLDAMPQAIEVAYAGWQAIGFRDRLAGYVCGIFMFEDHVRIIFEHGNLLPDASGILEGETKQTRHITVHPGASIPEAPIRELIHTARALGIELKTKSRV